MSAITGVYFMDGRPLDPADLKRMIKTVAHRGPNGSGLWFRGPVGLGHRMLWTTPESLRETLPLIHQTGDLVITADARIDNREELVSLLDLKDRPLGEIADSELILQAYGKWGESCLEKLLGDFAFAIWDAKKQMLFCARDHFGVKPFYYYRSDCAFIFASEIKALLCLQEVPRRLNEVRVADYLVPMLEDKEITFYQGILRLPPAHCMTVSRARTRFRTYWALDPTREIHYNSDEEYAEAFREIFTEAVRCRLRSAFPVGSMLSGGLDSSSIVCVARQLLAKNGGSQLQTFSAIFDEVPECDEQPFIKAVLALGSLAPHYVRADRLGPLTDVDRMLWHEDEPFYVPNLFMHWALYRVASLQGVRVLLDGIDGDTTVSHGIRYLTELARTGRRRALLTEVKGLSRHFNDSSWTILLNFALKPLAPRLMRQAWQKLRRSAWKTTLIQPQFARRIDVSTRAKFLATGSAKQAQTAREDHFRALNRGLIPLVLEVADKAAAAFSVNPVYPFFDRRLAEFCLAIPPEQKLHHGWTRVVMRRALAEVLPEKVRLRGGKSNLSSNFNRNLLMFERERLEEFILENPARIEKYVNVRDLRQIYGRFLDRRRSDTALALWKTATLAIWLRRSNVNQGEIGTYEFR